MTDFIKCIQDNWIIISILLTAGGGIYQFKELLKIKPKVDAHTAKISELIGAINVSNKSISIQSLLFTSKSPLTLVPEAEELLKKADFYTFFDTIKDNCVKKIEELKLKTRYDIQEKSREYLQQNRDDDIFIPVKTKAYEEGIDYWTIITAASIPLRDYYLEKHPEIKY